MCSHTEVSVGIGLANADLGLILNNVGSGEDQIARLIAAETLGQHMLGMGIFHFKCTLGPVNVSRRPKSLLEHKFIILFL